MENKTESWLIETIRDDGAEGWKEVAQALEDGAYLESIGVEDADITAVDGAHEHATLMAESHPDLKF